MLYFVFACTSEVVHTGFFVFLFFNVMHMAQPLWVYSRYLLSLAGGVLEKKKNVDGVSVQSFLSMAGQSLQFLLPHVCVLTV